MKPQDNHRTDEQTFELSLFCTKENGEAWRVRVWPTWLPKYLRHCFDQNGEAFPVYLDLEELDRKMASSQATYLKRESSLGGYELAAAGRGAQVLAVWLSQSFASGTIATLSAEDDANVRGTGRTN
ncbi:MAG TPA: hypothetical protein VKP30_04680 [Polyangiaceae bacterium]|nr:hypothetical protein [Polyangiaceae bacterium]